MALVVNDRVQQTGTANTTVSFTLSGSVVGYQSFAVIGNGNTTFYAATDVSGSWEVGVGTYSTTGPTLTRTTILSSSNSGSAVTFSGTVNVFVTYPSEQSVNLDASGNVTALGTIASGTWQGTTVGVAYGGTGVTASSGANSVMLRDANQNVAVNRLNQANTNTTAAGGTTALTAASTYSQTLNGTGNQTYTMPDATTLTTGVAFVFNNNATGTLTLQDYATGSVGTITPGGAVELVLLSNGTTAGTWDVHGFLPENVTWGTNALNLGSTVITNGTWNGGTIQPAYGGTGLTTFTGANNALYSTGSTTLTAGTLPVAAGGTGATTLTLNGVVYGNGTSAAGITAAGTTGQVLIATTSGAPSWGSVPAGSITGTVPIANGGTGQTTAAAAFNALSPLTTTGDIIYEASASTAARLPVGSAGQVLTVAGGIPSWATPTTGAGTITRTDFTATSGQTVFSVVYTVGLIDVYQNGAKLAQADFTATNGTSFTLATGATAGDLIQAEVFSSLNIYSTITAETFNGTGSQTIFTMSAVPANSASLLVAISGVVQDPTTYTVSSNTLTFSTAPPSGTGNIAVRYLGVQSVSTVSSFSAGTTGFTPATATTGGVVLAGTLATTNGGTGLTSVGTNGQVLTSNGTTLSYQTPTQTYPGAGIANSTGSAWGTSYTTTGTGTVVALATSPSFTTPTLGSATATQLTTGLGTVSAPALTFSGDTNTGIYSPAADTLAFVEGGVEAMRIDSSGNVGIGTTVAPGANGGGLAIYRSDYPRLTFRNSTTGDTTSDGTTMYQIGNNWEMVNLESGYLSFGTSNTERMRIDSSGNVGIGTSSPSTKLQVSTSGAGVQDVQWLNNSQAVGAGVGSRLVFTGTSSNNGLAAIDGAFAGATTADGGYMVFNTRAVTTGTLTERLRITSTGDVAIGSTTPKSGTAPKMWITGSNTDSVPALQVEAGNQTVAMGFSYQKIMGSGDIYFTTNNDPSTIKAYIAAGGNFYMNSGYGSAGLAYGCRAWVNFNGTGTVAIRSSGNVSSITDNGTGDYTVNFSNAMPDANYAVSGVAMYSSSVNAHVVCYGDVNGASGTLPSTTAFKIRTMYLSGPSAQDCTYVTIMVTR
jgi:trimeric autotransporter adhesin